MPGIDWSCSAPKCPSYVNNGLLNNSLTQVYTVYSNNYNHIFDLLFTKKEDKISRVSAISADFTTDHTILCFTVYTNLVQKKEIHRKVYNYKNVNWIKLGALLTVKMLQRFEQTYNIDVDLAWESWLQCYDDAVKACVPKITVKKSNLPPWFDSAV